MQRRDWWVGVFVLAAALLAIAGAAVFEALVPRYEWRMVPASSVSGRMVRIDRWTGEAQLFRARPSDLNGAGQLEPTRHPAIVRQEAQQRERAALVRQALRP